MINHNKNYPPSEFLQTASDIAGLSRSLPLPICYLGLAVAFTTWWATPSPRSTPFPQSISSPRSISLHWSPPSDGPSPPDGLPLPSIQLPPSVRLLPLDRCHIGQKRIQLAQLLIKQSRFLITVAMSIQFNRDTKILGFLGGWRFVFTPNVPRWSTTE